MVVKEVITYYVNGGQSICCTLLDATKAFDRVEYSKLLTAYCLGYFREEISRLYGLELECY